MRPPHTVRTPPQAYASERKEKEEGKGKEKTKPERFHVTPYTKLIFPSALSSIFQNTTPFAAEVNNKFF